MAGKKTVATQRKDETAELIADAVGRIRIVRLTSVRGRRLLFSMDLEDDTLEKAIDVADPADPKSQKR
jgi:hypothetical protein